MKDYNMPVVPFVGPLNSPKFENRLWYKVEIVYWIVHATNEKQWEEELRCFSVNDINLLQDTFNTAKSSGWAVGIEYPSRIVCDNGVWTFRLNSPTHLQISKFENYDYAYIITLANCDFYDNVKRCCLSDAKKIYPDIQISNIRICDRYNGQSNFPEQIEPYRGN